MAAFACVCPDSRGKNSAAVVPCGNRRTHLQLCLIPDLRFSTSLETIPTKSTSSPNCASLMMPLGVVRISALSQVVEELRYIFSQASNSDKAPSLNSMSLHAGYITVRASLPLSWGATRAAEALVRASHQYNGLVFIKRLMRTRSGQSAIWRMR